MDFQIPLLFTILFIIYYLPKTIIYLVENITGIIFTLRQPSNIQYTQLNYSSKLLQLVLPKKLAITINNIDIDQKDLHF